MMMRACRHGILMWLLGGAAGFLLGGLTARAGEEPSPSPDGDDRWALRPLVRPTVPAKVGLDWSRTPIDAFIAARLEERGLAPSPPADRRALIRRATHDALGLLPTPEEAEAFERDERPDAWNRLVARLLESPRYGERWARHWMDVAHFAETHGHDEDAIREHAWPYRDYLIRAFNRDKPYARFVQEQVAGDVLFPGDPQAVVATGFLAAGPWDASSQMGIQDGTVDKKIAQYLDRDDMITTVMGTFMSLTVHCARCHDHKFDPITQADYYALQAVFAGVDKVNRPYDPDPDVYRRRQSLGEEQESLEQDAYVERLLRKGDVAEAFAAWNNAQTGRRSSWVVLPPESVETTDEPRAAATVLEDGSILFGGPRPEKDTAMIRTRPGARIITALQLEVMSHPSLPRQGPGRQDNGNLHLSEFSLSRQSTTPPSSDGKRAASPAAMAVALRRAAADFDQEGWTISMALDGNDETAWGIYPQVGRTHRAVFFPESPLITDDETVLIWRLVQRHGGGHLIGRPRLSVTEAASPSIPDPLPEELNGILTRPPSARSPQETLALARYFLKERNRRRLEELPPPQQVFAVAGDFAAQGNFKPALRPRPVHFLARGDVLQPGAIAEPGALSGLPGLPARFSPAEADGDTSAEGWRRAALARWLTHPDNGLLWRSAANRIWLHHFGRGLVNTPNDFGKMGERPTHPALLDWLACELRDSGGSIKHLHRLIMTSAVYRQTSRRSDSFEAARRLDPDNRWLSRMALRRREAESIRDSLLQLSGDMDWAMGGPSDQQFNLSPGVHVTPNVDYLGFDPAHAANHRRGVYRFIFRTVPDPFMRVWDCPDASQWVGRRDESMTAAQALALLHNRFVIRQSEQTARRLAAERNDPAARIERLFLLAYGRRPAPAEAEAMERYAREHGLANACRMIMNSNEFLFVE